MFKNHVNNGRDQFELKITKSLKDYSEDYKTRSSDHQKIIKQYDAHLSQFVPIS